MFLRSCGPRSCSRLFCLRAWYLDFGHGVPEPCFHSLYLFDGFLIKIYIYKRPLCYSTNVQPSLTLIRYTKGLYFMMRYWQPGDRKHCRVFRQNAKIVSDKQASLIHWHTICTVCNSLCNLILSDTVIIHCDIKIIIKISLRPGFRLMSFKLTHLPLAKMAAILQTIFSDAFSRMKSFVF